MSLDTEAAERVRKFAQLCSPSQGERAGQSVSFMPWQWNDVVLPFYGTKRTDGQRQYRKLSLWIPRRNGKSFLMSILALYHLIADGEKGSHVVIIANSISQASVIFDESYKFVQQSELLAKLVWARPHIKTLEVQETFSKLEVLSAEKNAKMGRNVSACFFDEVADHGTYQRELYDAMLYSQANRKQPVLATLSSAGTNQDSLGRELYQVAKAVKLGTKKDEQLLPVIYEAGADEPWDEIKTARKANPSFGKTIFAGDFKQAIEEAHNNPRLVNQYKTYRLNQWVSSYDAWLLPQTVDQCLEDFTEQEHYGSMAYLGLDLARGLHDLSAYTILIPQGDLFYLVTRFFTPEDSARLKEEKEHVPYTELAEQGHVTLTAGDTIDLRLIKERLIEDCQRFNVIELGYDPNLANTLGEELRDEHGINTIAVIQSYPSLSDAVLTTEKYLFEQKIRFNNPLLRTHFINSALRTDNQNRVILDKQCKSGRIDGAQSVVIAVTRQLATPLYDYASPMWV